MERGCREREKGVGDKCVEPSAGGDNLGPITRRTHQFPRVMVAGILTLPATGEGRRHYMASSASGPGRPGSCGLAGKMRNYDNVKQREDGEERGKRQKVN